MRLSYDTIIEAFLRKIKAYEFLELDESVSLSTIENYMILACGQFNKICKYNLALRDGISRSFIEDIEEEDVDELVDIISEGMIVQWLKPYTYQSDNLENILNTRDYSMYSPAELLLRISNVYAMSKRDFRNMMFDYSYNHGDLGALHI